MPLARYLAGIRSWLGRIRRRPLDELLAVEYDDAEVRVKVIDRLEADWNQTFKWRNVERVCFQDAGLTRSDILFIQVRDRSKPVVVLTEARGGSAFFGALTERGLFPEEVWRRAMGDTSGGTHCWPPQQRGDA